MTHTQRTQLPSALKLHYRALALAVTITAVMPGLASARDQVATAEEKEACMGDVFRFCSSHIPDRTAITACLRSRQANLSEQCRYVISVRDAGKKRSDSK
ncbi:hypothetical protein XI03_20440 [Bradyrhizobium sp. CCBAU 65884]|nr:hypothetical protein [Bradyrhizobium sp. CCBAU 65884]